MKKSIISALLIVSMFSTLATYADHEMMMDSMNSMNTMSETGVMVGGASMVPSKNIVENAVNSSDHTTLVAAVGAAGLADALQAEGPLTVFAPTNSAFAKLPAGTVDTLLKPENKADLTSVLTYHVVAGGYLASDLRDGMKLTTLEGNTLTFSYINGEWYVNNALIEIADVVSSNGVTYVIDTVLMPGLSYEQSVKKALEIRAMLDAKDEMKVDTIIMKYNELTARFSASQKARIDTKFMWLIDKKIEKISKTASENMVNVFTLLKLEISNDTSAGVMVGGASMVPSKNIVENAVNSTDHTTLVAAVGAAGLADALQAEGPLTVFAPTNSAFAKLPAGTVDTLLKPENKADLTDILTYHVVAGGYLASDLVDGLELTTLQGMKLSFTIKNNVVHINGTAMVGISDIISSNGVTHVIDNVLVPSK